jgi:hypothetical protein
MFAAPEEVAMHRQLERDPTEFFSVVGAPYVRERVQEGDTGKDHLHDRLVSAPRRPRLRIGFVTLCALVGAFVLGMFATAGTAHLSEVAYQAAETK